MYKQTCFHVVREQLIYGADDTNLPKKLKAFLHVHVAEHPVANHI